MGLRSTIEIDLKDEKFKQFEESFERYQDKLKKLPGAWANVDKGMKSSFEAVAAALLAQQEVTARAEKEEKGFKKTADDAGRSWSGLVRSTKSVTQNIKEATTSLLKWAGIGGVFTGLIGGGGLFGLDLLAAGSSSTRRTALGLGVTFGEQRAFGLNYGRVIDSDSYLTNVNAALHDVTKRSVLYAAGLREDQLRGKDTSQVATALIPALKALADRTPQALLGQVLQARGLDQIMSLQDFERLKNTSGAELEDYRKRYGSDVKSFGLDDRSARVWQDFDVQMSRAGRKIESVFIRGLEPLIPSLTKFSDAFAEAIKIFLENPKLKVWLEELGQGVEGMAKYLMSAKFQADLRTFSDDVAAVAEGLVSALRWLGLIPDKEDKALKAQGFEKHSGSLPFTHYYTNKDPRARMPVEAPTFWNRPFTDTAGEYAKKAWHWFHGTPKDQGLDPTQGRGTQDHRDDRSTGGRGASDDRRAGGSAEDRRASRGSTDRWTGKPTEDSVQAFLRARFPGIRITEGESKSGVHVRNSMHKTGEAVDVAGVTYAELKSFFRESGFPATELLNENYRGVRNGVPSTGPHVHVGWRPKHQVTHPKVTVEVLNSTGGNVVVASNQVAR